MEELSHSQKLVGKLQISFCDMWEISCSYTSRWWYYLFFVNSLPDYFQSQQQGVAVEQWNPPTVCDFAPKSQIFGVIQLILDSVRIWIWVKLGDWCQGSVRFRYSLTTNFLQHIRGNFECLLMQHFRGNFECLYVPAPRGNSECLLI